MLDWDGRSPAGTAAFCTSLGKKEVRRFFVEENIWTSSYRPKRDTNLKHDIR